MYLILFRIPCPHLLISFLCVIDCAVYGTPAPHQACHLGWQVFGRPQYRNPKYRVVYISARTAIWDLGFYKHYQGQGPT